MRVWLGCCGEERLTEILCLKARWEEEEFLHLESLVDCGFLPFPLEFGISGYWCASNMILLQLLPGNNPDPVSRVW